MAWRTCEESSSATARSSSMSNRRDPKHCLPAWARPRGLSSRRPLARRSFAEALPCVKPRSDSLDVRKPRIVGPPAFTVQRNGLQGNVARCSHATRLAVDGPRADRKSTRLNSSHSQISDAVLCLKTKKQDDVLNKENHRQETYECSSAALAISGCAEGHVKLYHVLIDSPDGLHRPLLDADQHGAG